MPSKRYKKALEAVDGKKTYPLKSAVEVLAKFPKAKFNETIDLAFRLGVDPKQSDQMVRGTVPLPHGSGKTVRVLVFARSGPAAEAAKAAGAEFVGFEDMIKKCQEGWTDFHVAVGKASFNAVQLEENARAVIEAIAKARPHTVKGAYIQTCTISATMS